MCTCVHVLKERKKERKRERERERERELHSVVVLEFQSTLAKVGGLDVACGPGVANPCPANFH